MKNISNEEKAKGTMILKLCNSNYGQTCQHTIKLPPTIGLAAPKLTPTSNFLMSDVYVGICGRDRWYV